VTFTSVDDYIDTQPPASRPILQRVRDAIRKTVPGAQETISYNIPAYKLNGRVFLYFAGWKDHFSIYPVGSALASLKQELAPFKKSKGTIQFPLAGRVPIGLIRRIAKLRAAQHLKRNP
jgi:uncharacterized protein YdhG (YjbR/CyaY superfamily)